MSNSNSVRSILKINDLCPLCYKTFGENSVNIVDEVGLGTATSCLVTAEMSEILLYVTGAQFSDHLTTLTSICEFCTKSAINCYKFINMCRNNLECLANTAEALHSSFNNTTDDLNMFKTLFVSMDSKTSEQYYDIKGFSNTTSALKRFRYITQRKNVQHKKTKERKTHNFNNKGFLEICNLIQEKKTPTKFQCKVCLGIYNKSFNFKKHYYSQHSPKVLKCDECSKSYGSEALLKQHKYDCHSSMVCSECGKKYTNRYSLLYHMRRHTGEQPYECKFCGQKFQWSSRRAEHIRRLHKEPGVECETCHTKFRTLGSLYDHRKRHLNPNSRLHVAQKTLEEVVTEELPASEWQEAILMAEDVNFQQS